MSRIIEIIVSPEGQSTVQTRGFSGRSCQEASRFIEQALGTRTGEQLTTEFYQQEPARQIAQEGT
jgi:hypothetical protein